ncbi:MAG: membrane protein insertase YidC [Spirochaetales bacterium]|nr:membrane protein insertase YidC [Spirochaetales bacterium]
MDWRTLLAVALSVLVMSGYAFLQTLKAPKAIEPVAVAEPAPVTEPLPAAAEAPAPLITSAPPAVEAGTTDLEAGVSVEAPSVESRTIVRTDVFEATFTNRGGELVSLKLLQHADRDGVMDLVLDPNGDVEGFAIAFGGPDAAPSREFMNVSQPDANSVVFERTYFSRSADGALKPFTLTKRYQFAPGEYMFRLEITLTTENGDYLPLDAEGKGYTLSFGPQIGPRYEHLSRTADFRKFVVLLDGKRKVIRPKGDLETKSDRFAWSAISGKYFTLIAIPDATSWQTTFESTTVDGKPGVTAFAFTRPAIKASRQTDTFMIYAGPKSSRELARYDGADRNAFKRAGDRLEEVLEGGNILGWLESLLKVGLNFFYGIVKNYGVAIVLLTILVKAIMFPLTKKGSMATARMAEFQPRIKELQEKYKSNPQKLNQEMAALYQKEGYNPLSGCLPMLIQIPLFIAMYALFNNHFDLRGASFIPGWISDLSQPEAIVEFPTITLLFIKVSAIRALPIIYLASQLLYGKFTQQPTSGAQSAGQMKMMMYGMPIMFFFILYDVPSGLLVYWIVSNVLTIFQQIAINKIIHAKRAEAAASAPAAPKLIAPNKGTRKK